MTELLADDARLLAIERPQHDLRLASAARRLDVKLDDASARWSGPATTSTDEMRARGTSRSSGEISPLRSVIRSGPIR